jgi:N-acetylglucosamine-6-phosphate deacetylase
MWTLFKTEVGKLYSNQKARHQMKEIRDNYLKFLSGVLSLKPAEVVGIDKQKGSIKKGKLADIVIIDLEEEFKVTSDLIHNKHK